MSDSSYQDRGGTVGTNNPNDPELKRQFWAGDTTVGDSEKEKSQKETGSWLKLIGEDGHVTLMPLGQPSEGQIATGRRLSEGADNLVQNGVLARIGFGPDHATLENDEAA